MHVYILTFLFTLCISFSIESKSMPEQELVVHLKTQENLVPVYLADITGPSSHFSAEYLKQLHKVLAFDLSLTGRILLHSSSSEYESALTHPDIKFALAQEIWKKSGLEFVIVPKIDTKKISFFVFGIQRAELKIFKEIQFQGFLTDDRRTIHRISDSIHKVLFGIDGIASTKILYALQTEEKTVHGSLWKSEIWEADYDGDNATQLTQDGTYCINPLFYNTQQNDNLHQFLYVTYKLGPPKIFLASTENPTGNAFISLRGNQILPSLSRKKDLVAFISDAGGRPDLFVQYLDSQGSPKGKPIQAYSFPDAVQASPTFSPDGSSIAFVSDRDGSPRIYLIPTPKPNIVRKLPEAICLTKKNKENTCPNWSPNGRKMTYSATTGGVRQIWVYDFSSEEERQLTHGPGHKENPVWAPDGFHILYNSTGSSSELYLINLNQPEPIKISSGSGKKHYPAWES